MSSPESKSFAHNRLAEGIHASAARLALVATGGGSLAFSALLTTPGASRSVVEGVVPYSSAALTAYLGARPEQFCSEPTARQMAMAAYQRARSYELKSADGAFSSAVGRPIGVSCTCSLVSDRPKRGPHRVHCAAQSEEQTINASLDLTKGARSRIEEEELAAALFLNVVAQACGVAERAPLSLQPGEQVQEHVTLAPPVWRQLYAGQRRIAPASGADQDLPAAPQPNDTRRAIFPGAFHPLHAAHLEMARIAESRLRAPVEWEISIANVDKPPIDFREMELRSEQFAAPGFLVSHSAGAAKLWFTWAPTFAEKAALFPNSTFLVGADTIARIAQPRYYHNDAGARDDAIRAIAAQGGRFLVFGRATESGFHTAADLGLPPALRALCDDAPADFRHDLSSTEIRRQASQEAQP